MADPFRHEYEPHAVRWAVEDWLRDRPWLVPETIDRLVDVVVEHGPIGLAHRAFMATKPGNELLTPEGKASGLTLWDIVKYLTAHVSHVQTRRRTAAQRAQQSLTFPWARLVAVVDGRSCASAEALHGSVWPVGEEPGLPLADCGSLNCRCRYMQLTEGMRQRLSP
jgi:hypothetical protein